MWLAKKHLLALRREAEEKLAAEAKLAMEAKAREEARIKEEEAKAREEARVRELGALFADDGDGGQECIKEVANSELVTTKVSYSSACRKSNSCFSYAV